MKKKELIHEISFIRFLVHEGLSNKAIVVFVKSRRKEIKEIKKMLKKLK